MDIHKLACEVLISKCSGIVKKDYMLFESLRRPTLYTQLAGNIRSLFRWLYTGRCLTVDETSARMSGACIAVHGGCTVPYRLRWVLYTQSHLPTEAMPQGKYTTVHGVWTVVYMEYTLEYNTITLLQSPV